MFFLEVLYLFFTSDSQGAKKILLPRLLYQKKPTRKNTKRGKKESYPNPAINP